MKWITRMRIVQVASPFKIIQVGAKGDAQSTLRGEVVSEWLQQMDRERIQAFKISDGEDRAIVLRGHMHAAMGLMVNFSHWLVAWPEREPFRFLSLAECRLKGDTTSSKPFYLSLGQSFSNL